MNRNDRFVWPQAIGRKPLVATHWPQTTGEHSYTDPEDEVDEDIDGLMPVRQRFSAAIRW